MSIAGAGNSLLRAGRTQSWSHGLAIRSALLNHQRWSTQYASDTIVQAKLSSRDDSSQQKRSFIYRGAMSDAVRRVKILSLSTCCLSMVGGPVVTFFTNPELSVIMKGAMCSTIVLLSAGTTFGLHWFASPYIHKLTWVPGSREIDVEMLSWMATKISRKIKLSDIRSPYTQRPLVTFSANNEYYFIEKERFRNRELLDKLLPDE